MTWQNGQKRRPRDVLCSQVCTSRTREVLSCQDACGMPVAIKFSFLNLVPHVACICCRDPGLRGLGVIRNSSPGRVFNWDWAAGVTLPVCSCCS